MKRVTVTLPDELVEEIDRWERNRSRFILVATERELEARRREALELSLNNPHAESFQVAEAGIEDWDSGERPEHHNGARPFVGSREKHEIVMDLGLLWGLASRPSFTVIPVSDGFERSQRSSE